MQTDDTLLREFAGWLSGDIPELHQVEVPRLAASLDRFLARRTLTPNERNVVAGAVGGGELLPPNTQAIVTRTSRLDSYGQRWDLTLACGHQIIIGPMTEAEASRWTMVQCPECWAARLTIVEEPEHVRAGASPGASPLAKTHEPTCPDFGYAYPVGSPFCTCEPESASPGASPRDLCRRLAVLLGAINADLPLPIDAGQVLDAAIQALAGASPGASPAPQLCESECNPYVARCGAKFCTEEAMELHNEECSERRRDEEVTRSDTMDISDPRQSSANISPGDK